MGIFCSRAAFSLPAGPRRSLGYACGRQVAAALPENKIYPFKTASNLEKREGFFASGRRSPRIVAAAYISTPHPKALCSLDQRQKSSFLKSDPIDLKPGHRLLSRDNFHAFRNP